VLKGHLQIKSNKNLPVNLDWPNPAIWSCYFCYWAQKVVNMGIKEPTSDIANTEAQNTGPNW